MKKLIKSKFVKYCICGSTVGVIEIGLFYLFNNIINFQYIIANAIAFTISVILSYYLNMKFVFNVGFMTNKQRRRKFIIFFVSRIGGLFVDTGVLACCISVLHIDDVISKFISCISTTVVNYFVGKVFIFK